MQELLKKVENTTGLKHKLKFEIKLRESEFVCRTCKTKKPGSEFVRHSGMRYGIDYECKICRNNRRITYGKANPEKVRITQRKTQQKLYYADHEKSKKHYRDHFKRVRATNIKVYIDHRMGAAIRETLAIGSKNGRKWCGLVGYTVDEFMNHLEAQFTPAMNWNNYGSVWVIDHIIPKSFFKYDSVDSEDFRSCWALTNIQPLLYEDNARKGAHYIG